MPLTGHFDAWFLADQPDNNRAARAADIAALLSEAGQTMISISKNLRQALRRAQGIATAGRQTGRVWLVFYRGGSTTVTG